MTTKVITIQFESEREAPDLAEMTADLLADLAAGYLGDPSDWQTFRVVTVTAAS